MAETNIGGRGLRFRGLGFDDGCSGFCWLIGRGEDGVDVIVVRCAVAPLRSMTA